MKDWRGERITPKQMAQSVLMSMVDTGLEFFDEHCLLEHLSDAEKAKVLDQAVKLQRRIAKLLQYESRL